MRSQNGGASPQDRTSTRLLPLLQLLRKLGMTLFDLLLVQRMRRRADAQRIVEREPKTFVETVVSVNMLERVLKCER